MLSRVGRFQSTRGFECPRDANARRKAIDAQAFQSTRGFECPRDITDHGRLFRSSRFNPRAGLSARATR